MGAHPLKIFAWLNRHSGVFLLTGVAASLVVNALAYRRDRAATCRVRQSTLQPSLPETLPRVSFLLPAWNEADHLAACVDCLLGLHYPNKEIVICAGGKDGSLEIARENFGDRASVLEQLPGEGKQKALQKCFDRSTGEIIFLTDADSCVDTESFLKTIVPIISSEEVACTGSRQPLPGQASIPLVAYQWAYHRYLETLLPDYLDTLYGINAAVHRSALEKINGFNTKALIGTDLTMGRLLRQAGYRIRFIRTSRVFTDYQSNISAYIRQQSRWFRNRMLLGAKYAVTADLLSQSKIGGVAAYMLAVPLVMGLGQKFVWCSWLAGLFHLAVSQLRVFSFLDAEDTEGHKISLWFFFPYLVISWLASARGLIESLLPAMRGSW